MNSDNGRNENFDLWLIGKCIFCKEKVEEDSKILKCLHIICKDCTKRESTDSGVRCKCKIVTKGELIDYSAELPNKQQVKCSETHQIESNHNKELMMNYPLTNEFVPCPICMKKCIEVFCTKCSKMICSLCHLLHHKKHDFKLLSEMATEAKADFQTLLIKISKDNNNLKCQMQMLDKSMEKLMTEKTEINDKIDKSIIMLHIEIDKIALELKKLLETTINEAVKSININKEVLNVFKKENEYYHSLTSSVIYHNKLLEYIKLSKIFNDKMVIASSQIQDIPKVTVNCKPKLVYNDEEYMKKCVESIQGMGNIISLTAVNLS